MSAHQVTRVAVLGSKILAAMVSVTIVVASYWVWNTWSDFKHSITIGAPIVAVPPTGSGTATPTDIDGPDQNILIIGNDSRAGATPAELAQLGTQDDGGSSNTDTMMVLHVPGKGKSASVISFPRDSYVAIPGHGMAKLNAAYPDGYASVANQGGTAAAAQSAGVNLLVQTLQQLSGLTIDHYAQVSLLGFLRISNAIKGVPVVLCTAQQEVDSGINLPAGRSVIQGPQAMAFVRQRENVPGSDFGRIERQQYFLRSAFHTLLSSGSLLFEMRDVLLAVGSSLITDPSLDLLSLATTFSYLAEGNVGYDTIPHDGTADRQVGGQTQNVVLVSPAEVTAYVAAVVGAAPAGPAPGGSDGAPGPSGPSGPSGGATTVTSGPGVLSPSPSSTVPIGTGRPNVPNQPGCID